jgi:hypothetical protein
LIVFVYVYIKFIIIMFGLIHKHIVNIPVVRINTQTYRETRPRATNRMLHAKSNRTEACLLSLHERGAFRGRYR